MNYSTLRHCDQIIRYRTRTVLPPSDHPDHHQYGGGTLGCHAWPDGRGVAATSASQGTSQGIVSNLHRDASTAFLTPYGPTIDIAVLRGTIQGDPLSPLLFDLMMEPLIRWLTTSKKKGYQFGSTGLTLASKWYADDATLLANSAPNMIS